MSSLCLTSRPLAEMDTTRQKALVIASVVTRKKEEEKKGKDEASSSTPKAAGKGASKRKNYEKDDCPNHSWGEVA